MWEHLQAGKGHINIWNNYFCYNLRPQNKSLTGSANTPPAAGSGIQTRCWMYKDVRALVSCQARYTELALKICGVPTHGTNADKLCLPGSVISQMWQTFLLSSHTKQPLEINREHDPILFLRLSKGLCLRTRGCVTAERSWFYAKMVLVEQAVDDV